jgi:hypothetical protein
MQWIFSTIYSIHTAVSLFYGKFKEFVLTDVAPMGQYAGQVWII